ncbi:hypothetical protein M1271_00965 [Patescibacteria group bacterium]|nr:hypothetical protein [Patescibacteria group bacterium]
MVRELETQNRESEAMPHPYGVRAGTPFWTGYSSGRHEDGKAPPGTKVWLIGSPRKSEGLLFYYVEIESPPELKGTHTWLSKLPKEKGWI